MNVSRRFVLGGIAASTAMAAMLPFRLRAAMIDIRENADFKARLTHVVKVAFPHTQFPQSAYERNSDAILGAASADAGKVTMLYQGMMDLKTAGFDDMDDATALAHLESIENTQFFQFVRGTTIVTLYDDPEVWEVLGYEGPSFDKGGYINRGFNDLDWLPDPKIA